MGSVADADRRHRRAARCRRSKRPRPHRLPELLEAHPGPLVTTELVIAETGWLLDRQLGAAAEAALYESAAAGEIRVEPLLAADWTRIAALTVQYADQHLGGVDSSLIAVAERLGARSIGTLDRRHFGIVRPQHIAGFELLP